MAALLAVLDGVGFTWRLGTALVRAAVGGVVGLLSGLVVFALLGLLVPKEWGCVVWNGGAMLTGVLAAVFAFLDSFRRLGRPTRRDGGTGGTLPRPRPRRPPRRPRRRPPWRTAALRRAGAPPHCRPDALRQERRHGPT